MLLLAWIESPGRAGARAMVADSNVGIFVVVLALLVAEKWWRGRQRGCQSWPRRNQNDTITTRYLMPVDTTFD